MTGIIRIKSWLKSLVIMLRRSLPHSIQTAWFGIPTIEITTKEYCAAHGYAFRLLRTGEESARKTPETPEPEVHWKFMLDRQKRHRHPDVWIAGLPGAYVAGRDGHVLSAGKDLLSDASVRFGRAGLDLVNLFRDFVALPKPISLDGVSAIVNSSAAGWGYFHWLTDALPRIAILRQAGYDLNMIDHFLVPEGSLAVIPQTLELAGLDLRHTRILGYNSCFRTESLLLTSLPGGTGNPPPWVREFLRNTFLAAAGDVPDIYPRRFHIVRRGRRCVSNEAELAGVFAKHGIMPIRPELLGFREQVALFSRAELVVAPHGAALTNLMFSPATASVIELFSPCYVNVCFWAIANLGGIRYSYMEGEGERPPRDVDPRRTGENMHIDPCKLADWLDKWL